MRYIRNLGTLSKSGQDLLLTKRVLVVGSGGLGGFVIEGLSRLGVRTIGVCDHDVVDESNLNRQLLSNEKNIGVSKIVLAKERINLINSNIEVKLYNQSFPNDSIKEDIDMYDLVIDCLDYIPTRKELANFCIKNNKKMIHGAVSGYYGQVAVISEENMIIDNFSNTSKVDEKFGNPYFIVSFISSVQVYLAVQVLLDRPYLKKGMYHLDIEDLEITKIPF